MYALFLIFSLYLAGLQSQDLFRRFFRWVSPVFPLADSRLKRYLWNLAVDVLLTALITIAVTAIWISSDFVGRLAGRLV